MTMKDAEKLECTSFPIKRYLHVVAEGTRGDFIGCSVVVAPITVTKTTISVLHTVLLLY